MSYINDQLADMLTRIRNGLKSRHMSVVCPASSLQKNVLDVLVAEGYVNSYSVENVRKNIDQLKIELKYNSGLPAIKEINRVSKSGCRVYFSLDETKSNKFYNGLGIYVLSTPEGVISDKEARLRGVGGEVLCNVF